MILCGLDIAEFDQFIGIVALVRRTGERERQRMHFRLMRQEDCRDDEYGEWLVGMAHPRL